MKKRNLNSLQLTKNSIADLSKVKVGGRVAGSSYVCPTNAADRPGCHSYTCHETLQQF